MPASWANAFAPTIALFGGTGMPVILLTSWLVATKCAVTMPVVHPPKASGRVRSAITTSSSEVLPARSPNPLIVTSTWLAPAAIAASVLAVAMPRSSWQWALMVTASMPGTVARRWAINAVNSPGRSVAYGVGDVNDRGAGVDGRGIDLAQISPVAAGGIFGRKLDHREPTAGIADHLPDLDQHLFAGLAELVFQVPV